MLNGSGILRLGDSALLFLDWEAFDYLEANNLTAGEWHEIHVIFDLDNATSEFIVDPLPPLPF